MAVFALGPIGLCAAAGARLMGATAVIGVDTIPELGRRNAANLHAALAELNEQEGHAGRSPTEDEVAQWVEQAKGLERAIEYKDGPAEPGAEDAPTPEEPAADESAPTQAHHG